jgi:hypothetical protein
VCRLPGASLRNEEAAWLLIRQIELTPTEAFLKKTSDALETTPRLRHLRDAQAEIPVHEDNFASCHNLVANDEVDGIGNMAVKLNHITGSKIEDFGERHLA